MREHRSLVPAVVVLCFVIALLFGIKFMGIKGILVPALLIFGMMVVPAPKKLVAGVLLVIAVQGVIRVYLPWVSGSFLAAVGSLAGVIVLNFLMRKEAVIARLKPADTVCRVIGGLLLWTLISGLYNGVKPVQYVQFLFNPLSGPIIFVFALIFLDARDWSVWKKGLWWFFGFSVLMNIGWVLGVNPVFNSHLGTPDMHKGLFLDHHAMAYFSLFMTFYMTYMVFYKPGKRLVSVLLLGACFLQFVFTFAAHAMLFGVLSLLAPLGVILFRKYKAAGLVMLAGVFILMALSLGVFNRLMRDEMASYSGFGRGGTYGEEATFSKENLEARWQSFWRQPKGIAYKQVVFGHPPETSLLFGEGPANFVTGTPWVYNRDLVIQYFAYIYTSTSGNKMIKGSSITQYPSSGVINATAELGHIGLVLNFLPYFLVLFHFWRKIKNADKYPPDVAAIHATIVTALIYFLLLSLLAAQYGTAVHALVWLLCGMLWRSELLQKERSHDAP